MENLCASSSTSSSGSNLLLKREAVDFWSSVKPIGGITTVGVVGDSKVEKSCLSKGGGGLYFVSKES